MRRESELPEGALGFEKKESPQTREEPLLPQRLACGRYFHKQVQNKYKSPKNNDYAVNKILEDPSWLEIIEVGIKVKNELSKILSDEEKNILLEEIDHRKYC